MGGEEFGVLLPNTKMEDALVPAERLRIAVQDKECAGRFRETKVTAGFGVATFGGGTGDIDALLHNADDAMYQAKLRGRNQVFRFE